MNKVRVGEVESDGGGVILFEVTNLFRSKQTDCEKDNLVTSTNSQKNLTDWGRREGIREHRFIAF